ncbi:hypothetical protein C0Q70_19047 [Pomacea canaliculata]|uniref:Uncharacterized protein n=1 Tax=Pomacea canaliculata TaxID=400727 RepID=A0A2T7NI89_POMCA|nr:hypothetical protein C0Q70_19047 [Pomacea canaliculata]
MPSALGRLLTPESGGCGQHHQRRCQQQDRLLSAVDVEMQQLSSKSFLPHQHGAAYLAGMRVEASSPLKGREACVTLTSIIYQRSHIHTTTMSGHVVEGHRIK